MKVRRAVVDTNVLISAALRSQGIPRTALNVLQAAEVSLLFCEETFEELSTTLRYRKFARYLQENRRKAYLVQIADVAEWVTISGARMGCRDPDDDKFLETAFVGGADCLITGDRDLLEMSTFKGIPVLTPAGFLAVWRESASRD